MFFIKRVFYNLDINWDGLMAKYQIGQEVILKSDHSVNGAIMQVLENDIENKYVVFTGLGKQTFYESQILAVAADTVYKRINKEELDAILSARLICNPSATSLYSLNTAKIDFIPHQFRPVLKFVRSDNQRLLIADGVGVGKTIEAGLILRELEAREDIESVLVICPKPLISESKWQNEMKRFGEDFVALDGKSFRYCLKEMDMEGEWPARYRKCVVPYSLFDEGTVDGAKDDGHTKRDISLMDIPAPQFDLVIVDEAHHIRNTATFAYRAVERFCEAADSVIFLTATPVQLYQEDLFVLLNLLEPEVFIDKDVFYEMAEPNQYISKAVSIVRRQKDHWQVDAINNLRSACNTKWGDAAIKSNPKATQAFEILAKKDISAEDRVKLISDIEDLHAFSKIINRTRRRDIGAFTIRKPVTVNVPFTVEQQALHDEILNIIANMYSMRFASLNIKFLMTTIRRQAASCLFGLIPFLNDILYHNLSEVIDDDELIVEDSTNIDQLKDKVNQIIRVAKSLPNEDPKYEALERIVRIKIKDTNNKILIFSSFIHTLNYLYKKLKLSGYRVGMVTGKTPDDIRVTLRDCFNPNTTSNDDNDAIDILLMSEVGCEGLDYQFCNCMINYDLPWNPMRIEQRIGRIDRNGQKSDIVTIYNMITPDTVDADIYERCLMRIGVFQNSIGDCDEILGKLTSQLIDVASNFKLTEENRREKLQQIADNEIRLTNEQEELEEKQQDLFGLKVPTSIFEEELKNSTNDWLDAKKIESLINEYLNKLSNQNGRQYFLGEHELKTLRLGQELKQRILNEYKAAKIIKNPVNRAFEKWLKSDDQHLQITFDSQCSKENKDVMLINITHPLTKLSAKCFGSEKNVVIDFHVYSNKIEKGVYPFVLYQWKFLGEKQDLKFKAVSADERVNDSLIELIEESNTIQNIAEFNKEDFEIIEEAHHSLWRKELEDYKTVINNIILYKEESLKTSHNRTMNIQRERLARASDDFDRSMTSARIRKREEQFEKNIQKLEDTKAKADIVFEQIGYCRISVEPQD